VFFHLFAEYAEIYFVGVQNTSVKCSHRD
jgi:hypothetical protein